MFGGDKSVKHHKIGSHGPVFNSWAAKAMGKGQAGLKSRLSEFSGYDRKTSDPVASTTHIRQTPQFFGKYQVHHQFNAREFESQGFLLHQSNGKTFLSIQSGEQGRLVSLPVHIDNKGKLHIRVGINQGAIRDVVLSAKGQKGKSLNEFCKSFRHKMDHIKEGQAIFWQMTDGTKCVRVNIGGEIQDGYEESYIDDGNVFSRYVYRDKNGDRYHLELESVPGKMDSRVSGVDPSMLDVEEVVATTRIQRPLHMDRHGKLATDKDMLAKSGALTGNKSAWDIEFLSPVDVSDGKNMIKGYVCNTSFFLNNERRTGSFVIVKSPSTGKFSMYPIANGKIEGPIQLENLVNVDVYDPSLKPLIVKKIQDDADGKVSRKCQSTFDWFEISPGYKEPQSLMCQGEAFISVKDGMVTLKMYDDVRHCSYTAEYSYLEPGLPLTLTQHSNDGSPDWVFTKEGAAKDSFVAGVLELNAGNHRRIGSIVKDKMAHDKSEAKADISIVAGTLGKTLKFQSSDMRVVNGMAHIRAYEPNQDRYYDINFTYPNGRVQFNQYDRQGMLRHYTSLNQEGSKNWLRGIRSVKLENGESVGKVLKGLHAKDVKHTKKMNMTSSLPPTLSRRGKEVGITDAQRKQNQDVLMRQIKDELIDRFGMVPDIEYGQGVNTKITIHYPQAFDGTQRRSFTVMGRDLRHHEKGDQAESRVVNEALSKTFHYQVASTLLGKAGRPTPQEYLGQLLGTKDGDYALKENVKFATGDRVFPKDVDGHSRTVTTKDLKQAALLRNPRTLEDAANGKPRKIPCVTFRALTSAKAFRAYIDEDNNRVYFVSQERNKDGKGVIHVLQAVVSSPVLVDQLLGRST